MLQRELEKDITIRVVQIEAAMGKVKGVVVSSVQPEALLSLEVL